MTLTGLEVILMPISRLDQQKFAVLPLDLLMIERTAIWTVTDDNEFIIRVLMKGIITRLLDRKKMKVLKDGSDSQSVPL
tara:strand:- start:225 stop:461 length:237 start_codon:yes stop_codon:yes gene_type:complete